MVHTKGVGLHQRGSWEALKGFEQRRKEKIFKVIRQPAEQSWMGWRRELCREEPAGSRQEMMAVAWRGGRRQKTSDANDKSTQAPMGICSSADFSRCLLVKKSINLFFAAVSFTALIPLFLHKAILSTITHYSIIS